MKFLLEHKATVENKIIFKKVSGLNNSAKTNEFIELMNDQDTLQVLVNLSTKLAFLNYNLIGRDL